MKIRELLQEFAPSSGGGGDDDLERMLFTFAKQWYNADSHHAQVAIEERLDSLGWEIGYDEGYDPFGVFVVQSGDINGRSYISWPPEQLRGIKEAQPPGRYLTGKEKVKNISPVLTKPYGKAKQTTLMKNFFGSS